MSTYHEQAFQFLGLYPKRNLAYAPQDMEENFQNVIACKRGEKKVRNKYGNFDWFSHIRILHAFQNRVMVNGNTVNVLNATELFTLFFIFIFSCFYF